jgi:hypothetical protein
MFGDSDIDIMDAPETILLRLSSLISACIRAKKAGPIFDESEVTISKSCSVHARKSRNILATPPWPFTSA